MSCHQCSLLEEERFQKIKTYVELRTRREPGERSPGLDAEIAAAEAAVNEVWRRWEEHRTSHRWSKHAAV